MNSDLLRTFITIVDTGSISRAAAQLYRTPSAISMQMKRLEEQLGQTLFVSQGRERVLSHQGQQLVGYARRILALQQEALRVMDRSSQQAPLRLGCPDDYATTLLPALLALIREDHHDLLVEVITAPSMQLRMLLDRGELDLALVTRRPDTEEGHLLYQDQAVWLAAAEFDWQQPVWPLALYPPDCRMMNSALDGLDRQGRQYRLHTVSAGCNILLSLVRRGEALSAMPRCSVPDELLTGPAAPPLPVLPTIEVALIGAARPHPLFSDDQLLPLVSRFTAAP